MSRDSSTADQSADTEDDYYCPICQEVFKNPVRTKTCKHVFCKSCFETAVNSQGPHCPMCRGPVPEKVMSAKDVQKMMSKRSGHCRACGAEKILSKMRLHYKSCRKYVEEYGLLSDAAPTASSQIPAQTQTHSNGFSPSISFYTPPAHSALLWMQPQQPQLALQTESALIWMQPQQHQSALQPESAGRVYACPYCPLVGLRDMALVQHCVFQHARENRPAVCPICMQLPWGDANYHSQNLIAHMVLRHSFSYAGYMNEEEDEDVQIWQALQNSVRES